NARQRLTERILQSRTNAKTALHRPCHPKNPSTARLALSAATPNALRSMLCASSCGLQDGSARDAGVLPLPVGQGASQLVSHSHPNSHVLATHTMIAPATPAPPSTLRTTQLRRLNLSPKARKPSGSLVSPEIGCCSLGARCSLSSFAI
ncbi:hypothetical protein LTR28_000364, partial [Elasticomyces elasticus]